MLNSNLLERKKLATIVVLVAMLIYSYSHAACTQPPPSTGWTAGSPLYTPAPNFSSKSIFRTSASAHAAQIAGIIPSTQSVTIVKSPASEMAAAYTFSSTTQDGGTYFSANGWSALTNLYSEHITDCTMCYDVTCQQLNPEYGFSNWPTQGQCTDLWYGGPLPQPVVLPSSYNAYIYPTNPLPCPNVILGSNIILKAGEQIQLDLLPTNSVCGTTISWAIIANTGVTATLSQNGLLVFDSMSRSGNVTVSAMVGGGCAPVTGRFYVTGVPENLFVNKNPVVPMDNLEVWIAPAPLASSYTWKVTNKANVLFSKVTPDAKIYINDVGDDGDIYVEVEYADGQATKTLSGTVSVGCPTCTACGYGQGQFKISSIDARFSLGKTLNGQTAGEIVLMADENTLLNASSPSSLKVYTLSSSTVVFDHNDPSMPRQVISPESFVDIVRNNENSYDIKFYNIADKASWVDETQSYSVLLGALPKKVWRIQSPDMAQVTDTINIIENPGSGEFVRTYRWIESTKSWKLTEGGSVEGGTSVLRNIEKTIADFGTHSISTEIVYDKNGVIASKKLKYDKDYLLAGVPSKRLWKEVVDPDGIEQNGDEITTEYDYYHDPVCIQGITCGKVKSRVASSGNWTAYIYDAEGRVDTEFSSWKNVDITFSHGLAREIKYGYTSDIASGDSDTLNDHDKPRLVTEYAAGIVTAKTWHVFKEYACDYDSTKLCGEEIVERAASQNTNYGATDATGETINEHTSTTFYSHSNDPISAGKIRTITHDDGTKETYTYERGSLEHDNFPSTFKPPSAFNPNVFGQHVRLTITFGTDDNPNGIIGKTVIKTKVSDAVGKVLQEVTYLNKLRELTYHNGEDERVVLSWTEYAYDVSGHLLKRVDSTGSVSESQWGCCNKESDTDKRGIVTTYDLYDGFGRLLQKTENQYRPISTTYEYDAQGRILHQTEEGGELTVFTSRSYDYAGRITQETDGAGLITGYIYLNPNTTTVIHPGGFTETSKNYSDGKNRAISGSAVVAKTYDYGVDLDGNQWTIVYEGPTGVDSPMWRKTTIDMLGRHVRTEEPGPKITSNLYNAKGQIQKQERTGSADIIYQYDELGDIKLEVIDTNNTGSIEYPRTSYFGDKITKRELSYISNEIDGNWWREEKESVYYYPTGFKTILTTRTRLGTLGQDNLTAETIQIDVSGKQTIIRNYCDRAYSNESVIIDYPDSNVDSIESYEFGYLVSSTSKTGIATAFGYDALGRLTDIADQRTGASKTSYNTQGRVDWRTDAAGKKTSYTYYSDTGRLATETDPNGAVKRYAYNASGAVTNVWGSATYPVQYVYDDFGRKISMQTWRDDSNNWNASEWPESQNGDMTRWVYFQDTGLLEMKIDSSGRETSYTYYPDGSISTRTWPDGRITSYTYYSTGNLRSVTYSDTTPAVQYNYDENDRMSSVLDVEGLKSFSYNADCLKMSRYGGLTYYYYNGRLSGMYLNGYPNVSYNYDNLGRPAGVNYSQGEDSLNTTYTYVYGTDLFDASITSAWKSLSNISLKTTTFGYEPSRNLITSIENQYDNNVISRYDYTYDDVGRRTTTEVSGTEFSGALLAKTSKPWFNNAQVNSGEIAVLPDARSYTYDSIGNRITASGWDDNAQIASAITYQPNNLNQYDLLNQAQLGYDLNGNLTEDHKYRYTYDGENRLATVEPKDLAEGVIKVSFTYDYMGRRVSKNTHTYQNNAWVTTRESKYRYDGWNLLTESNASNQIEKSYLWGIDLSGTLQGAGGIGGLIASKGSTSTDLVFHDANGNVVQLVDPESGATNAYYEYDPFGNVTYAHGDKAATNPYRFSTKYHDDETGLVYYGYRYYSQKLGRWLNRDPINELGFMSHTAGFGGAATQDSSFSLGSTETELPYVFVENDPIGRVDPLGLWQYAFNEDKSGAHAYGHIVAIAEKGDTLSDLAIYWTGDATRYGDIAKANSHKDPDCVAIGDRFDVFEVMPGFYRANVGTNSGRDGPNCWNTALAYHGIVSGPDYTDLLPATRHLLANFTKGSSAIAGDIVVYTSDGYDPTVARGNLAHFAVYLADGYAFTKNGYRSGVFEVMKVSDVDRIYGPNVGRWMR